MTSNLTPKLSEVTSPDHNGAHHALSTTSSSPSYSAASYAFVDEAAFVEFFRSKGLRWTIQRQIIVGAVLNSQGHFSAEIIFQQINLRFPLVNVTTIYRTLQLLSEMGIIVKSINPANDLVNYELMINAHQHHHHLNCKSCGSQLDLPEEAIETFKLYLQMHYGFTLELQHFMGTGLCKSCSS